MGRWEPDAPARLERAALELFDELGYEQATTAGIAQRAGLSERTFFRHCADKREVLFSGAAHLQTFLVERVAHAAPDLSPLEAVTGALADAGELFEARRAVAAVRQRVLGANPALHERELIKLATLSSALAEVLRSRGTPATTATLAVEAGITVFGLAHRRWVDADGAEDFPSAVHQALADLRAVTAAP